MFLLGLLLLWPGLIHGDLFVSNDTISYLRGADTLFLKAFGHQDPFFAAGQTFGSPVPLTATDGHGMVLYGRSIYFGLFLYTGLLAGSLWLPAVAQALATGALIVALVRHFTDPAHEAAFLRAFLAAFALAACTPLPFFVCYLMPDLAVGLSLPAMALLLAGWQRERRAWRIGLFVLALFAALSHSTAALLFLLFGVAGLGVALKRRTMRAALPAALVILAGVGGLAGEAAFGLATRLTTGATPVRPPFITGRLIEDGPARRYLMEHCADSRFTLCRYPLEGQVTAESFLWLTTRPGGGFKALPVADAVRVSREQLPFAMAVAQTYPLDTATALARDVAKLTINTTMEEFRPVFVASRMRADTLFEAVPPGTPMPLQLRLVAAMTALMVITALIGLVWVARAPLPAHGKRIVFLVLAAIMANDVICACLSGPFARYNTRVIWSLPLVVLLCAAALRERVRAPDT